MPYLSAFDQDVLVCFADDDNVPFGSDDDLGWANNLGKILGKLLVAHGITGGVVKTTFEGNLPREERLAAISRSATVIVILSPAFIESPWTTDSEARNRLLAFATQSPLRTFLVLRSDVDQASVPDALWRLKHRLFWQLVDGSPLTLGLINPAEDQRYVTHLNDVAYAVAKQLKTLRDGSVGAKSAKPRAAVYLAEVTPDLSEKRAEIERFLEQYEVDVRPRGHLPSDFTRMQEALRVEMAGAVAFVQLLSDDSGHLGDESRPRVQLAAALAHKNLPILQWRDPSLDLTVVAEKTQRDFLLRPTVHAESISDFQQAVWATLQPQPQSPATGTGPVVFVDARPEDDGDLQRILNPLRTRAQWAWHNAQAIAELRRVCDYSDAVLVFWGSGASGPSQARYFLFKKHWQAKKKNLSFLRICDGPPLAKPPLQGAGLPVITCRDGSSAELIDFIDKHLASGL